MKLLLQIFALFYCFWYTSALRCYTCTAVDTSTDQRCVTDPDNVESGSAITDCNKPYCYSIRIEYLDPKNVVKSMVRGCADVPPVTSNKVVEDGTHRIYYRVCQKDLCNGGSGKGTSGGNFRPDTGGEGVILVPSKNGAISFVICFELVPLLFVIVRII